jgi:sugar lactone lactonase YvrE
VLHAHAAQFGWINFAGGQGVTGQLIGMGSAAQFYYPHGVAVDGSGNVYVADTGNQIIREIAPGGTVTTLAGSMGVTGSSNGTGAAAQFFYPGGVAVDGSGNVYVADTGNGTIREIAPGGAVTTLAGTPGVTGTANGTGAAAQFLYPKGIAVDGSGNVYVADSGNHAIREIAPGGVVTTLAGSPGVSGTANGTGGAAQFFCPGGVAVDGSGNVYVADTYNHAIREIAPGGVVTTLAGSVRDTGAENGTGAAVHFYYPSGVAVDGSGNVYVADTYNLTIREVTSGGVVTTIGGTPGSIGSQAGVGSAAQFYDPYGIAVSSAGLVYVADEYNSRIAFGTSAPFTVPPVLISPAANGTVIAPVTITFTLPGPALPGSVQLIFYNGVASRVLTLSAAESGAGQNSFSFDPANPTAASAVTGISGDTSIPLGTYTVTLSYQDAEGDPPATASAANVTVSPIGTLSASAVNSFSSTLNGDVSSDYSTSQVSNPYFEWGTAATYGNTVPAGLSGSYSAPVTGLASGITYHYQFVGTVNGSTYYGGDQTFTSTSGNPPPSAQNQTFYVITSPSQPATLNVLAGDSPGNPTDSLTVVSFSKPAAGALQIIDNGTMLLYTPNGHYAGYDTFTYTVSNGVGGTATATAYVRNPYLPYAGTFQSLVNGAVPGYLTVTLGTQGSFTGSLRTLGGSYSFNGVLAGGSAVVTLSSAKLPTLTLDLSLAYAGDGDLAFTVNDPGNGVETGDLAERMLYSGAHPAPETGRYTAIIIPPATSATSQATASATLTNGVITSISVTNPGCGYISAPTVTIAGATGRGATAKPVLSSGFVTGITLSKGGSGYTGPVTVTIGPPSGLPQGTGFAIMSVTSSGLVTISGKLGDGTAFSAGSWIVDTYNIYETSAQSFLVFSNVYSSPAGYILGTMTFENQPGISDFDGGAAGLSWYKPPQTTSQLFSGGFNLALTMLGSAYVPPASASEADYLPDLQTASGNALLSFNGGNLPGQLQNGINIGPVFQGGVTDLNGSLDSLSMSCSPSTGAFLGSFIPPGARSSTHFGGVFFQKQNLGLGTFTGSTQSGSVNVTPQ